jgi:hypothetical protein
MALNILSEIDVTSGGDDVYEAIVKSKANWALMDASGPFSTTTTLTTAQVNALRATPIEVVTAPGTGLLLEYVSGIISYNYTTTAFTVGADEDFIIQYDGGTDASVAVESAGFCDQTNDEIRIIPPIATALTVPTAEVNKKLEIFNTGSGETADGGTSTIIVKVIYRVHATGL